MTLWFVDASVLLARKDTDDANHGAATQLLEGADPLTTLDLAYYEVTNVAVRSWRDHSLLASAAIIAEEHGISASDAAYVAAARGVDGQLVSCDVRDPVSRGLACLPGDALQAG